MLLPQVFIAYLLQDSTSHINKNTAKYLFSKVNNKIYIKNLEKKII